MSEPVETCTKCGIGKPCNNARHNRGIRLARRQRAEQMILMRQRGRSWGQIAVRFGVNKSNARASVLIHLRKIGP